MRSVVVEGGTLPRAVAAKAAHRTGIIAPQVSHPCTTSLTMLLVDESLDEFRLTREDLVERVPAGVVNASCQDGGLQCL